MNTSTDAYGNGIPDECEADCNTNGTSDHTEIQADITLDKDRNDVLDACQDCDSNGTTDLVELADAHHLWVATGLGNEVVRQFLGSNGVLTDASVGGASAVNEGQDLIVGPGGKVLVTSGPDNRVMEFDADGNFVGNFIAPGAGGLAYPTGLILSPSGRLLVSSRNTDSVLAYDGSTGASQGAFVSPGSGGLLRPFGLTYGPNGNLFVTSDTDEVMEYNGGTGAFVRVFVPTSDNGRLDQPRGLAFKPDGNLLVASFGTDEVLEFQRDTGIPRGKWAHVGTATRITQDSPWGIRIGPNGHVFVTRTGTANSSSPGSNHDDGDAAESHLTDARMFEYDVCTGDFRKTQIGGMDHGLDFATGFDFVPGFTTDCNLNELPDSCDIASGASLDGDFNGVPDECQIDCNSNGTYDRLDIYPFGASLDCNCNFIPDDCDLAGDSTDCNGNNILDECEIVFDCNDNGMLDICEIADGAADDCNTNDIIDVCETVGDGILLEEDFDAGLPADWTATGIFGVTDACPVGGFCGSLSSAYAGDAGSCTYGNGEHGGLVLPLIDLPPGTAELSYCSALSTEAFVDLADVVVNNVLLERLSGGSGNWESRTVNLSQFSGQTIQIIFRLASDPGASGTLGWIVDNVKVTATQVSEDCNTNGLPDECEVPPIDPQAIDCNTNGIPDECDPDADGDAVPNVCDNCELFNPDQADCQPNNIGDVCDIALGSDDTNGNGVPDECEPPIEPPLSGPAPHDIPKNRFISVDPNNAIAVSLRVELLDLACSSTAKKCNSAGDCKACVGGDNAGNSCSSNSNCTDGTCELSGETCDEQSPPTLLGWVGDPAEAGGDALPGTFTSDVVKAQPATRIWTESVVHIGACEIAPVETYAISATANGTVFSSRLILGTIEKPDGKFWGDVVGNFDGATWSPPNVLVNVDDVSAILKFLSLKPAPHVTVLDLVGTPPTYLNFDVNATDLQMVLEAFGGKTFPPLALTGIGYPADGDVTQCP